MRTRILLLYLKYIKRLNSSWRIIDFACRRYKNKTFIVAPEAGLELSFGQLRERIDLIALFLSRLGLAQGDRVAFSAPNCHEFFEIRAACHALGLVFFGIPAHLGDETLEYFIKVSGAKALFYRNRPQITVSEAIDLDSRRYTQLFQGEPIAIQEAKQGSLATLNLSSGTTQKIPRIVQLSDSNWVQSLYGYLRNSDTAGSKNIVFLCTVPFLTAGSTTFLPSFLAGVKYIIIKEHFSLQELADTVEKYAVNRIYITPSRLLELLTWCRKNKVRLNSLDTILTGTEKIPAARLKEAIDFFGPIIHVGYGMVEALPPVAMLSPKGYKALESAGRVVRGVAVKIMEDGRIAVKSSTVSPGYLDNPDENSRCFRDGWFYSNDYGFFDKEGFLHILGRKEELLREAPRMIFASQVEDKLYELPFIDRCAVVNKDGLLMIFASLQEPLNSQEATKKISGKFQEAGLLNALPEIVLREHLPVNALGKLDRNRLMG